MTRRKGTPKAVLAQDPGLPPYPVRWAFLKAYEAIGTITGAADAVGIHRSKHYDWLKLEGPQGDAYRKAFAEAHAASVDALEAEAVRRAKEGEWELVTHNGGPVMVGVTAQGGIVPADHPEAVATQAVTKRKKSDALLIFLLKGQKPAVYGDARRVEVTGAGGSPVQIEATVEQRTDDFSEGFWRFMELSGAIPGQEAEEAVGTD